MRVLTPSCDDRPAIAAAFADPARITVIALCAAWCDTCAQFRGAFERLAQSRPETAFVWLDIEDDADVAGDIDVENFPTLAICRGDEIIHYAVSLPHETTVGRLIDALATHARPQPVGDEVSALPARLVEAKR